MTDYVDKTIDIAFASAQRADFLRVVDEYRGSLSTLKAALRVENVNKQEYNAWFTSGK